MLGLILMFCCIGSIFAQTPGIGQCPYVESASSFNITKFYGRWYENRRSIPNFFETETKCVKINYSASENDKVQIVKHRISSITGRESVLEGSAVVDSPSCRGSPLNCSKFVYTFSVPILGSFDLSYWILDTDYNSYALVYSCNEILGAHYKYLWVLTRESTPSDSVLDAVNNAIAKNELQNLPLLTVDHSCE
ncbi:hypothetical protein PV327_007896 [Microctonus hyperodae]|uniref:Lipocalin/cytosolic fatty-acid binding domain-containing protein n=1 Tax=Microctonus hyperodae TaxID=165561 RepID=A0AA39G0V1_MICHY|nr:hypothetical protein PV327_007896 [Microctonus hyperodae]